MTATTWQAPLFFDPDKLEGVDNETTTLAYTPPVMIPDDHELEPDLEAAVAELPPAQQLAAEADVPETTGTPVLPSWIRERIELPASVQQRRPAFGLWWLLGSLAALLVAMLVVDAWRFVAAEFSYSWFTGTLFLLLTLSVAGAAGYLAWRAWQDIHRLRSVNALQEEGERVIETNGYDHAMSYIRKLACFYTARTDLRPHFERFYVIADSSHHDREVCALFSRQVLGKVDEQALRIVVKRSNETALLVMVSPMPLLSTILTLWRTLAMVRDVATIYGGKPGFIGMMSLIGLTIQNLLYADVSEMLAESTAEIFGNSVLSVVSAQMAQGVGSSLLTARVGLKAMQACRPMPFLEDERPRLKDIRGEIVKAMRQLLGKGGKK